MYYTNSTIKFNDNPIRVLSQPQTKDLYEFVKHSKYEKKNSPELPIADLTYYKLYFKPVAEAHEYSRVSFSLSDYIGYIWGLFSIIMAVIRYPTSGIISRYYTAELLGKTYEYQNYTSEANEERESAKTEMKEFRKKKIDGEVDESHQLTILKMIMTRK